MKILGLVGGTTWLSTIDYYRYINKGINEKLGGVNFAECMIYSLNFADVHTNNEKRDWDGNFRLVMNACEKLISGGAEGIVLCANTMHLLADRISEKITIPIIHIAEATADEIRKKDINTIALLGTKFTMEEDFFKLKLAEKGIEMIIPDEEDRNFIHDSIFNELAKDIINPDTKKRYLSIIDKLTAKGAEGVILGCTEIPLLIKQEDVSIPAFDTTLIHSKAAVEFDLS
jgi:aspartate racemase